MKQRYKAEISFYINCDSKDDALLYYEVWFGAAIERLSAELKKQDSLSEIEISLTYHPIKEEV